MGTEIYDNKLDRLVLLFLMLLIVNLPWEGKAAEWAEIVKNRDNAWSLLESNAEKNWHAMIDPSRETEPVTEKLGPPYVQTIKNEPDPPVIKPEKNHLFKRDIRSKYAGHKAAKYLPDIRRNAERFRLDPGLILAIIHTESYFNPLAVSRAGAIGLMQLMPLHGGREAYQFLYDSAGMVRKEHLYSPQLNLELGSAYLYLLENKYFADIKEPVKRRHLIICAYNWGPTAIQNKILNRYDVKRMSSKQVFDLLCRKTPLETRKYLVDVTRRMINYSQRLTS